MCTTSHGDIVTLLKYVNPLKNTKLFPFTLYVAVEFKNNNVLKAHCVFNIKLKTYKTITLCKFLKQKPTNRKLQFPSATVSNHAIVQMQWIIMIVQHQIITWVIDYLISMIE